MRGVSTLDALGRALAEIEPAGKRLAVIDARRGEVFFALYSADGERLSEPAVSSPQRLAERLDDASSTLLAGGSGAVRFRQQLASRRVEVPEDADPVHRIAARHVCATAASGSGKAASDRVVPIYLRPPDAERWRERDSVQKAG